MLNMIPLPHTCTQINSLHVIFLAKCFPVLDEAGAVLVEKDLTF